MALTGIIAEIGAIVMVVVCGVPGKRVAVATVGETDKPIRSPNCGSSTAQEPSSHASHSSRGSLPSTRPLMYAHHAVFERVRIWVER